MTYNDVNNEENLLQPDNMIRLYARGAFPMADEITGKINWYMPDKRAIIPINDFNIPRSLRKFMEENDFDFRFDFDYLRIIKNCSQRDTTWISNKLITAYKRIAERGFIHSVETWKNNKLVGGLYGVSYRGAFFGESMFSKESQASKVALVKLLERLNKKGFVLLDVQFLTKHLEMFGAKEITFEEYEYLLLRAYQKDCYF